VVVFSDFECPYCAGHEENLLKLREEYGDLMRLVFKHYPLSFHQQARPAAIAAEAARVQGKFWEMHRALFANQANLGPELYLSLASDLGLAVGRFKEDLAAPRLEERVKQDMLLGDRCKMSGTPTTYFNGFQVGGAVSMSKLRRHASLALARSYLLLRRGVRPADVYTFSIHPESLPAVAQEGVSETGKKGKSAPPRFPKGFSWDDEGFSFLSSVRSGPAIQPPQKP
jgi:predicted DsbA family dithiol-disulfide isomerase